MQSIKILLLGLIFPVSAFPQIQSFEFAQGLTNTLSIPAGKIIRIHSLIGSSVAHWVSQQTSASAQIAGLSLESANRGIIVLLPSGRQITLSPFSVSVGGSSYFMATSVLSSISSVSPNSPLLLPGPITIAKNGDDTMLLVYEILDNINASSLAGIPSQGASVVIPTSAAGDVDIKLEQSADNVTWTECLPGTYNSSTVKRFFRLRAVEK